MLGFELVQMNKWNSSIFTHINEKFSVDGNFFQLRSFCNFLEPSGLIGFNIFDETHLILHILENHLGPNLVKNMWRSSINCHPAYPCYSWLLHAQVQYWASNGCYNRCYILTLIDMVSRNVSIIVKNTPLDPCKKCFNVILIRISACSPLCKSSKY